MTSDVMTWLQEARKLDAALLDHFAVAEKEHPQIGRVAAFPYLRDGKPYAAKFRTLDKQFRSSQGVTRGLYNADALTRDEGQPIVITEGEIDCLSVVQSGFARAVSLPDGWTPDGGKTEALQAAEDALRASPAVIVAGDDDEAGESLPRVVANLLEGHPVKVAKWPEGCKDPNDVLVKYGEGELAACLNAAVLIDPPGGFITGFSDLPPLSRRRVLRVGIIPFDYRLAFECGALSVGTGMPGMGKTTFMVWALEQLSRNERVRIGAVLMETHPHAVRDQLARIGTGKPWNEMPREQQAALERDWDDRWRLVHRTFDDGDHHLGWLRTMVRTLATRDRCKVILIDPWNELEHLPEAGESMTAYINWATKQLRVWAEKYEVHICLIAHPRKMPTDGKSRAPTGYDVADSAAFANKPALGFSVHQVTDAEGLPVTQIVTWKVRNTQLYGCSRGTAEAHFDMDRMTYERIL